MVIDNGWMVRLLSYHKQTIAGSSLGSDPRPSFLGDLACFVPHLSAIAAPNETGVKT